MRLLFQGRAPLLMSNVLIANEWISSALPQRCKGWTAYDREDSLTSTHDHLIHLVFFWNPPPNNSEGADLTSNTVLVPPCLQCRTWRISVTEAHQPQKGQRQSDADALDLKFMWLGTSATRARSCWSTEWAWNLAFWLSALAFMLLWTVPRYLRN